MDKEYYEKISTGIIGPEDFVKKSLEFLLKREQKEDKLSALEERFNNMQFNLEKLVTSFVNRTDSWI